MATRTAIEWTQRTWNPMVGCTKISPGCTHCYAEIMSMRLASMARNQNRPGRKAHYVNVINERGRFNGKVQPVEEALGDPLRWKQPSMIFVNSMSDLFHKNVPLGFILRVLDVMHQAHRHTFQVLTKRSDRLLSLDDQIDWPKNVWMGITVENAEYQCRIDDLRQTHARTKFLSVEPLLGPIPRLDLTGIDWVIVGGESGPEARPMDPQWVRDIRDQCVRLRVPFFFKQWGGVNKKKAGRELDGRIWDQMPCTGSTAGSASTDLMRPD